MSSGRLAVALLAGLLTSRAHAGLLDSPPPTFPSGAGKVVYRMGPLQYDPGWADTIVTCTNLSDAPAGVSMEVFDHADVRTAQATASLAPGAEVSFVTSAEAGVAQATVLSGLSAVDDAKARVSATTAKLNCGGRHRVVAADGTVKEMPLELLKKVARDE